MIVFRTTYKEKDGLSAGQASMESPAVKFGFWFWRKHGLKSTVVIKESKLEQQERHFTLSQVAPRRTSFMINILTKKNFGN